MNKTDGVALNNSSQNPTSGQSGAASRVGESVRLEDEPEPPDSGPRHNQLNTTETTDTGSKGRRSSSQSNLRNDESFNNSDASDDDDEVPTAKPNNDNDKSIVLSTTTTDEKRQQQDDANHARVHVVPLSESVSIAIPDSSSAHSDSVLAGSTRTGSVAVHRPHCLTVEQSVDAFNSNIQHGLLTTDANARLDHQGFNSIREAKAVSIWTLMLRQVANALTVILLAAMALSFGVHDWVEGGVVCAVIAVNVIIGFVQEYKAENALASLRTLSSPTSTVLRDGKLIEIEARNLVTGDVVLVKTGDVIPADVRIVSLTSFEVDEAPLTGESVPVLKTLDPLPDPHNTLAPADRTNLAFAGTTVTKGRATGVVVATGMDTQIGLIAAALDKNKKQPLLNKDGTPAPWWRRAWEPLAKMLGLRDGTPLQRKLARFAIVLLGLAILCAIIVFAVAEFDLNDDVVLYAIALGIGVLPESLVAVLTITFSVGAKRMAKANVIVRKLEALEALGGVTDICSDKTGTLTHGKMIVDKLWTPSGALGGQTLNVEKGGASVLEPKGRLIDAKTQEPADALNDEATHRLCTAASLCNVAEVWFDTESKTWMSRGDPTETALQVLAKKVMLERELVLRQENYTLEHEYAFDSTTKRMTMMFSTANHDSERILFMKGAPERVLDCCSTYTARPNETIATHFDQAVKEDVLKQMERLASHGLRVLAFAQRKMDISLHKKCPSAIGKRFNNDSSSTISTISNANAESEAASPRSRGTDGSLQLSRADAEQDFHFVGLCGLYDPPRAETRDSVMTCRRAGVVVRMITGDHVATARAIAHEVGILDGTEGVNAVLSASDFDAMTDAQIDALDALPLVVARCSPLTKVRMIAAGKRRKRLLAMTGDGINDAPALLNAPIGIAMGSGTDVAKDSAELILTDDKFDNIAKAVKEGRTVFKNIQRFMIALLVLNVAEVLLLLIGLAIRDSADDSIFPISPIGVLFLNLIAGLPAIGLGFERAEPDVMRKPPHDLGGGVLSKQVVWDLFVYGITMGWTSLVVFLLMIYVIGNGQLGVDCNDTGPICNTVFEARSATFTTLFLQGLIIPWHLMSMEHSIFCIHPVKRLRKNPFLLYSVLFGLITIPICLYAPTWNTVVFRQSSLGGKGWGLALAAFVIFSLSLEAWKYFARRNHCVWLTRITGGQAPMELTDLVSSTEKSLA